MVVETEISVVIPVYNGERWIKECIQSVLGQTRPADEIIVVDDGSTDGTGAALKEFLNRDMQQTALKVIKNEKNMGIGCTRQRGVEAATGDYIAFLSADDLFMPGKLQLHANIAKNNPTACRLLVQYSNYMNINEAGQAMGEFRAPYADNRDMFSLIVWEWADRSDMFVNFSTLFAPKRCFELLPIDKQLRRSEDLAWILRACKLFDFVHIPQSTILYRRHTQMETAKRGMDEIVETAQMIRDDARKWWSS